ncbi:hypothetical protein BT93_H1519 [Corymbia citriodora subsp. variegata]|nr:hypothetical protein BT93_H1519 [Corymbia citriodora subsp. variegata]
MVLKLMVVVSSKWALWCSNTSPRGSSWAKRILELRENGPNIEFTREREIVKTHVIGQEFMITLSHANHLVVTIQYPYEKLFPSERFHGQIHFEFDKCIACEVCVCVCPIDLPVVDWKVETTNCLSMTEEYELSTYDHHELNYNQIALGHLPMSVINDYTIRTIVNIS